MKQSDRRGRDVMRVLVVGSHRDSGFSMWRYSELLVAAWRAVGVDATLVRPWRPGFVERHVRATKYFRAASVFMLFPFMYFYRSARVDAVHLADHSDAALLLFTARRCQRIVTVHDLIGVRAGRREIREIEMSRLGRLRQAVALRAISHADRLLPVSVATSSDVDRLCAHAADRSIVIPNPVDVRLACLSKTTVKSSEGGYLLIVGHAGWRKRRDLAVEAWQRLRQTAALNGVALRIVGPPSDFNVPSGVEYFADVDDETLATLYSGAAALLQLSAFEGFAWPVVESNLFGVPALCSDIAVLRETAGAGGVYVDTEDFAGIDWEVTAEQLVRLRSSDIPRHNSERFSWEAFTGRISELSDSIEKVQK